MANRRYLIVRTSLLFLFFVIIPCISSAADDSPGAWYEKEQAAEAAKTPDIRAREQAAKEETEAAKERKNFLRRERLANLKKVNPDGFRGIPFGASYDDVVEELRQDLHPESFEDNLDEVGFWVKEENSILLSDFHVGDDTLYVKFLFDKQKRFYSFAFESVVFTADNFDPIVINSVKNLTRVFNNKYGKPSKCFKPNFLLIKPNYVSFYCVWSNKKIEIFTGFQTMDFKYGAVGSVTYKEYELALKKEEEKNAVKRATEGAKDF